MSDFPVSPNGIIDEHYRVNKNDILFARTGASVGKTYLYNSEDGKLYYAGFLIRINVSNASSFFVYSQTLTTRYYRWVMNTSMRSGQPGINAKEYAGYSFYIPTMDEQRKISSFLKLIDERIDKQRQFIDALKSYKRGVFNCLFNSISEFKKLYEISEYVSSELSLESIKNSQSGDYAVYDASGIAAYIDNYKMKTNYIAIIKDGSGVGRIQFCKEKTSFIGTLGGIVAKNCSTNYLYAAMQMIDFRTFITGATIPHVYYKDYGKIKIPFPNSDMQHKIENISKLLDNKLIASMTELNATQTLKSAILQKIFI